MPQKLIPPTDEEDSIITAAALSDPDAQPLSDEQLENLCPLCSLHPSPNEITIAAMREAEEMLNSGEPLEGCKTISEVEKCLEEWSGELYESNRS